MIRILLVDDEPLLLESLEIVLTVKGNYTVVGTAGNGIAALDILKNTQTDVMLIDLNMPGMGGIELIKKVHELYPDIRMIVLTTFYDEKNITEALSNGASGYLLKDSGKDAIIDAVEQTVKGVGVLDAKVMQKLTGLLNSGTPAASSKENSGTSDSHSATSRETRMEALFNDAGLTDREKDIAKLIADGCTNSQIASLLYISEGTVKNYVSIIYDKFDIKDRAKLVAFLKA
ncbi:MAG: response regulator transcription factor [Lachnospiraceae bacterium]|nr:response regulator transcription factor [Lachnospiraceae bacterium]